MAVSAPLSQQEMRQRNLSRVLHTVAEHGTVSRAAVAARTGLTRAAVSTLVEELLRAGLVVELGPGRSGGVGRPGTALALADTGPCGIGAEVGVEHLAACAVDLRGQVRARVGEERSNRDSEPAPVLARLGELLEAVIEEAAAAHLHPAGLSLAVPELVARGSTTVSGAPNLGWYGTRVASHLSTRLPLTVDNEANFGALAQWWLGRHETDRAPSGARGHRATDQSPAAVAGAASASASAPPHRGEPPARSPGDAPQQAWTRGFLHVSAEAGIGAAVVLEGELLRGCRGFAGELGHVPVWPRGRVCPCGGRGCLEQYAGEPAVLRAAGITGDAGEGGSAGSASVRAVLLERAEQGDPATCRALGAAGEALGIALTGAVNLLDLQTVVLGGALARLGPWLVPSLERELVRRTAVHAAPPTLSVSQLGTDGPLLGAAHAVVRAVLDEPAAHLAGRRRSG